MEIGTTLLYFTILFGILSICSLIFAESKCTGNKIAFVRKVDDNWELIGISSDLDPCAK